MKKRCRWKIGLAMLVASCTFACGGANGSFTASPAGVSSSGLNGAPGVVGNPDTVAAVNSSPGAAEFLARNSFLGFSSLTDRSVGQNRYLVFTSRADLIPTDTNGKRDIYLRDLRTGEMSLASVASDGTQGDGDSTRASISADGRFVVFRSAATNLVAGDGNGVGDIFLRNIATGVTSRVSLDSSGTEANGSSDSPAISANGRYVVFASLATNLVATDGNGAQDIFLKDTSTGATTLVSTNSAGTDSAAGASYDPAISGGTTTEGEYIAFSTEATDIIGGGLNGQRQIVRIERATPANRVLISKSAAAAQADGPCYEPSLSNDGNMVAFFTLATNLGATADANSFFDVYHRDVSGNTTTCMSVNTVGNPGDGHSGYPSISADGATLAFGSLATNLVAGDSNGRLDVFRRTGGATTLVSQATDSTAGDSDSDLPGISLDGRYVAFRSAASSLVTLDPTLDDDIFVRDTTTASTFWATISSIFQGVWPGFEGRRDFAAGGINPRSIVTGDFNNDGNTDFAVANQYSYDVTVNLGDGEGGFSAATSFPIGDGNVSDTPNAIAAGDFNNDGNLDLVITFIPDDMWLLLGDGAGGFNSGTRIQQTGPGTAYALVPGYFNADGNLDLAVAITNETSVILLLGNGSGGFAASGHFDAGSGGSANPESITAGDFNHDGHLDVATGNRVTSNISVLLGDGAGNLGMPTRLGIGGGLTPRSIATGDFNGDGDLDLATANSDTDNVSVLLGDGTGAFGSAVTFGVGTSPYSVTVGDFNKDGKLDLTTANEGSNDASLILGNGAGAFGAATNFVVGYRPWSIVTGDFDKDTNLDVATANYDSNNLTVLLGEGTGGFRVATSVGVGTLPRSITTGDFNGDGNLDFATANASSDNVSVVMGDGAGAFGTPTSFSVEIGPYAVTAGDVNGDGILDLATANYTDNSVSVLVGDGMGGFGVATRYGVGTNPFSVIMRDVDGDGNLDIATANYNDGSVSILLGNGSGTFGSAASFSTSSSMPASVAFGDFNKDGKLDIATANSGGASVSILLGNGSGGFGAGTIFGVGAPSGPLSVATGDFDGDGNVDVATANFITHKVAVLLGDGAGGFADAVDFGAGTNPYSVSVRDFNGDGKLDIATANFRSNNVSVLLGDGAGGFAPAVDFGAGTSPRSLWPGDFDGDGDLDIVTANSDNDNVSVLTNLAFP